MEWAWPLALAASRRFAAAAILGGILVSTLGALILGVVTPPGHLVGLPPLQLAFSVHLREVFRLEYLDEILLVTYLLVADVVATLESIVAPTSAVSLRQADGAPRRLGASLRASGLLAIAGPLCGAGPVVVFFESVSAVLAGGRTWRCSLWVGLFFGVLLFVIPPRHRHSAVRLGCGSGLRRLRHRQVSLHRSGARPTYALPALSDGASHPSVR